MREDTLKQNKKSLTYEETLKQKKKKEKGNEKKKRKTYKSPLFTNQSIFCTYLKNYFLKNFEM